MSVTAPVIEVTAADVVFGRITALKGISLRIRQGESVALVGSNGSGKSTLLRLLHGLVACRTGQVHKSPGQVQAMLFQRPCMLRTSSLNNVALGLWLAGNSWAAARSRALLALERVGLGELAQRNGKTLSGGQQQRLALARAWALNPDVLMLDEPTASLDPYAKREVEHLMAEFAAQTTLIFSSHNLGQVKRLASRVLYLEQGRLLADLPTEQFFNSATLQAGYPAAHAFIKGELV